MSIQINKFRGRLYWYAKILGDLNALLRGKIIRRVFRRVAGKYTSKGLKKFIR